MRITDFDDLKKAFGTDTAAALALGMSRQHFSSCRIKGALPMRHYFVQLDVLKQQGHDAPKSLWGFPDEPKKNGKGK